MAKTKSNQHGATPVECPVLPIALRIGELWDAHTRAEELEAEHKQDNGTADAIERLRIAMQVMASFARARSMSGALFQIALATEAANDLHEQCPHETNLHAYHTQKTFEKLIRLLESVALLLREKTAPAEFAPVQSVIRLYLDVDGDIMVRPFKWLDDIPGLAKDYRDDKTA
jgi:hypothetical protein